MDTLDEEDALDSVSESELVSGSAGAFCALASRGEGWTVFVTCSSSEEEPDEDEEEEEEDTFRRFLFLTRLRGGIFFLVDCTEIN